MCFYSQLLKQVWICLLLGQELLFVSLQLFDQLLKMLYVQLLVWKRLLGHELKLLDTLEL